MTLLFNPKSKHHQYLLNIRVSWFQRFQSLSGSSEKEKNHLSLLGIET
jgi:hypothetical protein